MNPSRAALLACLFATAGCYENNARPPDAWEPDAAPEPDGFVEPDAFVRPWEDYFGADCSGGTGMVFALTGEAGESLTGGNTWTQNSVDSWTARLRVHVTIFTTSGWEFEFQSPSSPFPLGTYYFVERPADGRMGFAIRTRESGSCESISSFTLHDIVINETATAVVLQSFRASFETRCVTRPDEPRAPAIRGCVRYTAP